MQYRDLYKLAYKCLLDLYGGEGIYASARSEVFGCVFGRDSAITIVKILKFLGRNIEDVEVDRQKLLDICRLGITALVDLQGREVNIESGEEPGKFIHEFRKDNFERLTKRENPWYVYPDGYLRNYDSIDSTPLTLIAIYKYWKLTGDAVFLNESLSSVVSGLQWLMSYGDKDGDFILEYELSGHREHGGLRVQSWTDSFESLRQADSSFPVYPIAPVEVQGYAWLALKLWSQFFFDSRLDTLRVCPTQNPPSGCDYYNFAEKLDEFASKMKQSFNRRFIFESEGLKFPPQALDGFKNQIKTVTGNPLLLLWASFESNGRAESILEDKYVPDLVKRSFMDDLFVTGAGIRTMSSNASAYNSGEDSYHNGSFWPKLNGMAHEGLELWGYANEAAKLREASLKPISAFNTPIELYIKSEDGSYQEYRNKTGQTGCRQQAWSAATTLDLALLVSREQPS